MSLTREEASLHNTENESKGDEASLGVDSLDGDGKATPGKHKCRLMTEEVKERRREGRRRGEEVSSPVKRRRPSESERETHQEERGSRSGENHVGGNFVEKVTDEEDRES